MYVLTIPITTSTTNNRHQGHICPQGLADVPYFLTPHVYNLLSQLGGVGQDPSEDCLTLSVWSKPQVGEALKPVLVWIYGGGE